MGVLDEGGVPIVFLFGKDAQKLKMLDAYRYIYGGVEILIPY